MHNRITYPLVATILLCLSGGFTPGYAGNTPKSGAKPLTGGTAYTWYDGKKVRTVWLNPHLIAEFDPKPTDHIQTKTLAASATPVKTKQRKMKLWRLKTGVTSKSSMQQLRQQIPNGKISPVLHDGPSESNHKRALPGNIIVHLDPSWDQQQVDTWLKQHDLQIEKPLNIGANIFVLKTGPGLEALEKANALYLSGEVVAAYPNWWQEVSKR